MNPEFKDQAKFYCNFKVHKNKYHNTIPPVRPIISASGGITENISLYCVFANNKALQISQPPKITAKIVLNFVFPIENVQTNLRQHINLQALLLILPGLHKSLV